jgi:DNA-binding NarL/FixJ family response regulator
MIAADQLARLGLTALLDGIPAIDVIEAGEPGDAASLLDETGAAAVLWDAGWDPDPFDPDDLAGAGVPVLVLAPDVESAATMRRAGVAGVLPRHAPATRIAAGLAAVAAGLVVIDPAFASAEPAVSRASAPIEELTPREHEVLDLLADGLANKAIARQLGLSEHTVKFHVNAILAKLNAQSRTEAVATAFRNGLIRL